MKKLIKRLIHIWIFGNGRRWNHFIDAKGTILTANHVIEKAKMIRIMAGDKILDAKVVADAGLDIAILKVEGRNCDRVTQ